MEGVNWNKYLYKPSHKGRDEYDPFKMIKVILFAYMNQIYSLRRIELACKTDIRFMFIMQEEKPSHMAFQRFITHYLKEDIKSIFRDIFDSICSLDSVDKDTIYIDGTKMEANANKFKWNYHVPDDGYEHIHFLSKRGNQLKILFFHITATPF